MKGELFDAGSASSSSTTENPNLDNHDHELDKENPKGCEESVVKVKSPGKREHDCVDGDDDESSGAKDQTPIRQYIKKQQKIYEICSFPM